MTNNVNFYSSNSSVSNQADAQLGSQSSTETFPSSQEMTAYFCGHPNHHLLLNSHIPFKLAYATNVMEKVAAYFSGRQMKRLEIKTNLEQLLRNVKNEDTSKLLTTTLKQFVSTPLDKNGVEVGKLYNIAHWIQHSSRNFTSAEVMSNRDPEEPLKTVTALYHEALNDLLDKATFSPPSAVNPNWTRHVQTWAYYY